MSDIANLARVLRDAADYLAWYGWTRETCYAFTNGVKTPAACVMGAVVAVVVGEPMEDFFGDDDEGSVSDSDVDLILTVAELLAMYLAPHFVIDGKLMGGKWSGFSYVTGWNDQPDRTHEDVIAVLRSAAAAYERTNGGAA